MNKVFVVDVHKSTFNCCNFCHDNVSTNQEGPKLVALSMFKGKLKKNCYLSRCLNVMTKQPQDSNVMEIVGETECTIDIKLTHKDSTMSVRIFVDTGAFSSIISLQYLKDVFPGKKLTFKPVCINMVSVENRKLNCLGVINLLCHIGKTEKMVEFYCIESGNIALLGLKTIIDFKMSIIPYMNQCSVNAVHINNEPNEPHQAPTQYEVVKAKHDCEVFYNVPIEIEVCFKNMYAASMLIYQYIFLLDCNCLSMESTLCQSCCVDIKRLKPILVTGNSIIGLILPRYGRCILANDMFQIIPKQIIKKYLEEKAMLVHRLFLGHQDIEEHEIQDEEVYPNPATISMASNEIFLDSPKIISNPRFIESSLPTISWNKIEEEIVCNVCKALNRVFCDILDENCLSVQQFKKSILAIENKRCTLIKCNEMKLDCSIFIVCTPLELSDWSKEIKFPNDIHKSLLISSEKFKQSGEEMTIKYVKSNNTNNYVFVLF